jgi:hypothetical protein
MSILSALCEAVAAYYKDQGDKTKAGVVVACLEHDPSHFYAAVVRYPTGPYSKTIVTRTHKRAGSESGKYETAEQAIEAVALAWYAEVKPPPVKSTLEKLGEALR